MSSEPTTWLVWIIGGIIAVVILIFAIWPKKKLSPPPIVEAPKPLPQPDPEELKRRSMEARRKLEASLDDI